MIDCDVNSDESRRFLLMRAMEEFDPFRNSAGEIFITLQSDVEDDALRRTPAKLNSKAAWDAIILALSPRSKGGIPPKGEVQMVSSMLAAIARSKPRREATIAPADLLENCVVSRLINDLVEAGEFAGNATQLFNRLERLARSQGMELEFKKTVKSPDSLGKLLKSREKGLLLLGIKVEKGTRSDERKWIISRARVVDGSVTLLDIQVSDEISSSTDTYGKTDTSTAVQTDTILSDDQIRDMLKDSNE